MSDNEVFALYPLHKSVGVIVFIFAMLRIFIRIKEGWPQAIGNAPTAQLFMAKLVHWGLITLTALYPASGMMMSGGGGHGISVFGFEILASNYDEVTHKAVALNETIASIGHTLHEALMGVLIFLIVVHVAGAVKHHIIDKDETITRMFSFK
jgi:cytochrome b561